MFSINTKYNSFKSSPCLKSSFVVLLLFLLYFFSNNIIYAENTEKNYPDYIIPMGNILQIDAELKNVIVNEDTEGTSINSGDIITKINGNNINGYNNYRETINSLDDKQNVKVEINRGTKIFTKYTTKKILMNLKYNNFISGFATLTYIDPKTNNFGAVGHPISINDSNNLDIKKGCISNTKDISIKRSEKGKVGYLNAVKNDSIGHFSKNTDYGILGKIENLDLNGYNEYRVPKSVDEIKLGKAYIIMCDENYKPCKYEITILNVKDQKSPSIKTFRIKITDEKLLKKTGGIIQGMSGTPIVQDDKIIGAVSHAVESNPEIGYGLFIRWMF